MDLKKIFWNPGSDEPSDEPVPERAQQTTPTTVPSRPVHRPVATNPMATLKAGPSATMFERTTGLQTLQAITSARSTPAVDQEFDSAIAEALEQDSKEPGFKEFTTQFSTLSAFIVDKGQCTAAALAAVSAANARLNATQIARSIGERLQMLSGYESSYNGDCQRSEQTESTSKNASITEMSGRIQELDAEMARLQSERDNLEMQVNGLRSELSGVTNKYDGYRRRFSSTISARREQLTQMLNFVAPGAQGQKGA